MSDLSESGVEVERPFEVRLRDFTDRLELEDVEIVRWSGQVMNETDGELNLASADVRGMYRVRPSTFQCRWSVDFPIHASVGEQVAAIGVTLVQSFTVEGELIPASRDVIASYMRNQAFDLAMPYFREAIQTMGSKLGLGSIVLGLHKDELSPNTATFRIVNSSVRHQRTRTNADKRDDAELILGAVTDDGES